MKVYELTDDELGDVMNHFETKELGVILRYNKLIENKLKN